MNAAEVHWDVGKSFLLSAPASYSIQSGDRERVKNKISLKTQQGCCDRSGSSESTVISSYSLLFIISILRKHENISKEFVFSGKIFILTHLKILGEWLLTLML